MNNKLEEVVDILMYYGPSKEEIIQSAKSTGSKWSEGCYNGQLQYINVIEYLPFNTTVIDNYIFNSENQLIKHILIINGKETVIFDKFVEASELLKSLNSQKVLVS